MNTVQVVLTVGGLWLVTVFGFVAALLQLGGKMDQRFDTLNGRMDAGFGRMDAGFQAVNARIDALGGLLQAHIERHAS